MNTSELTPEQQNRYNTATELISAINKARKHRPLISCHTIASDFMGMIRADSSDNLVPSQDYVLNG